MLAVSERVPGYGRTPDQTIWHKPEPGHRCTGECDFHPIACSEEEGIVSPGPKRNVPIKLDAENERWCADCLAIHRQQRNTIQEPRDDTTCPLPASGALPDLRSPIPAPRRRNDPRPRGPAPRPARHPRIRVLQGQPREPHPGAPAMIQPGQTYRSADPRGGPRIRIVRYEPGWNRAYVVDAYDSKRPRRVLARNLHASPTTKNGTPRRTGYILEDT